MYKDVTLPSGVQVRVTSVPAMVVLQVSNMLPEPKVPMWYNEEKQRSEPHDLDPEYIAAVNKHKTDLGQLINQAYLANGIVKVLHLPEDKYELDSDEWIEGLEFVGIKINKTGLGRKVDWLQYHILGDADVPVVITEIAQIGGLVSEARVEAAADSFRPNQNGTTTAESQTEAIIRQRDQTDSDPTGASD